MIARHTLRNRSNPDFVIATFITFAGNMWFSHFESMLYLYSGLSYAPSIPGININNLIYLYPRKKCKNNTLNLFVDVLLNEKLFKGKPFKIIAILTHLNNDELVDLANIVSPFSIPIFTLIPGRRFHIQQIQKLYHYYNNVYFVSHENIPKFDFLVNFTKKLNAKMISLFHDYDNTEEIDIMSSYLKGQILCTSIYHMRNVTFNNPETLKILTANDQSNIFILVSEKYTYLQNFIEVLNNDTDRTRIMIIYNYYYPVRSKVDAAIRTVGKINFPLYVVKTYMKNNLNNALEFVINMLLYVAMVTQRMDNLKNQLMSDNMLRMGTRNLNPSFSKSFLSSFSYLSKSPDFFNVEVEYIQKINITIDRIIVYNHQTIYNESKPSKWICGKCDHFPDLEPVCVIKNCSVGHYPVYFSQGCCWKCQPCLPGFVKPVLGQHQCTKCSSESLPNQNQTKCIPFQYKYFTINKLQKTVAITLSSFGCIYASIYIGIFIWFCNTPMVKSSNLKLSIFQMLLHLSLNVHIAITLLEQERAVCFIHSIMGYYLLKVIMSIYIIKTNQLLTIFQADTRIDKSICLTVKEIFFPAMYLVVNIFITITVLAVYQESEHGLLQTTKSVEKYNYCKMTVYFYIDLTLVLILSIACSIQSFLARKLPTNYNETYYIFLGMFTTTVLLMLSIPLDASYNKDGQKVFVNSCIIYSANISLLTIAYGYKIYIMLFQKHRNTKEAFKKIMLEAVRKNVEKQTKHHGN